MEWVTSHAYKRRAVAFCRCGRHSHAYERVQYFSHTSDSTENDTTPKSNKSRNSNSSVQIQIRISICTARYREMWVSRFGGFWGCSNFGGNCQMKQWHLGGTLTHMKESLELHVNAESWVNTSHVNTSHVKTYERVTLREAHAHTWRSHWSHMWMRSHGRICHAGVACEYTSHVNTYERVTLREALSKISRSLHCTCECVVSHVLTSHVAYVHESRLSNECFMAHAHQKGAAEAGGAHTYI